MTRHALFTVALVLAAFATAHAQNAKTYTPPRTAWGEPDLQGLYTNKTITPLERPAQFAGEGELTDAGDRRARAPRRRRGASTTGAARAPKPTSASAYNEFWWDRGKKVTTNRSSLIIDPPDGRVPPLTADAQRRQAPTSASSRSSAAAARTAAAPTGPTDRSLFERCITRGLPGAMSPSRVQQQRIASCRARATSRSQIEMLGGTRDHSDRRRARTSASKPRASGWATRAAIGRATRSSSRRRTSATRRSIAARPRTCSLVERFTRVDAEHARLRVHGRRSDDVHEAVDRRRFRTSGPTSRCSSTRATKATTAWKAFCRARVSRRRGRRGDQAVTRADARERIRRLMLPAHARCRAHHAFAAEFDATQPITLRGTVTRVEWINPHTWIHIDVKDADGKVSSG